MPSIVDILRYQLELDDSKFTGKADAADAIVNKLGGSISGVLVGALGYLASAFAAVKIGEFIKDATLTAARTEVLGTALKQVGANAGVSVGRLALLEEQVKSLGITTQEARTSIVKFIQSGLPLEKVAQLARLAQDSAVIAGINSSEAFERLTRGIQTGQIELIRSAGVFVSIEQALNRFAKESGRAREGITDLERQTVILNEVLAQGSKLAGNYEAAMGDVGKQMTSLPRYVEEASNALGNRFKPLLEALVPVVAELAKGMEKAFTNDVIEANRKALVLEGDRATQLKQIVATEEEISRLTARIAELSGRVIDSFDPDKMGAFDVVLSRLKAQTTIPRLSDELAELRRQLAGLAEAAGTGIDLKISTAFQDAGSEERSKQIDRLLNLQKSVPSAINLPVEIVMETEDEAFMRKVLGRDLEPGQISVEVNLDDSAFRIQLEAQLNEIEKRYQRILKPILTQEFPGGSMSGVDDEQIRIASLKEAANVMRQKFLDAFSAISRVGNAFLRQFSESTARIFDDIIGSIGSFATGDIAGGVAGAINALYGWFSSTSETTQRLIVTNEDLIRAINEWEESVFRLTDRQRADQLEAAQRAISLLDRGGGNVPVGASAEARRILEAAGLVIQQGTSNQQLIDIANNILAELGALTISSDKILEANTRQEQLTLIGQARSASEAQLLVRSFIDLFDLSLEEQISLWEQTRNLLENTTLLSEEDRLFFATTLEELGDRIEDAGGSTQTERSIARITERQADTLVSSLFTLDLHLREVGQSIVNAITNLQNIGFAGVQAAGAGGAAVNIGAINVYAPSGSSQDISKALVTTLDKEYRAVGGVRLKG